MDATLPDYLIREQAAVGSLFAFWILRVIVAAIACARGWRILAVEHAFICVAALWCAPSLIDWLWHPSSAGALAEFEGNAVGCTVALFFAPILSHRLGYE